MIAGLVFVTEKRINPFVAPSAVREDRRVFGIHVSQQKFICCALISVVRATKNNFLLSPAPGAKDDLLVLVPTLANKGLIHLDQPFQNRAFID